MSIFYKQMLPCTSYKSLLESSKYPSKKLLQAKYVRAKVNSYIRKDGWIARYVMIWWPKPKKNAITFTENLSKIMNLSNQFLNMKTWFHEFLSKNRVGTVWKFRKFSPNAKIFRQIDLQYNSLVKKIIWRNFCKISWGKILQISTLW